MKQRILLPMIGLCLAALAVFGAYRIDMHHMENSEPVTFGTWGYDYCPPEETPEDGESGVMTYELPAPDETDGIAALYLRVLNDLWEKDSGLNGGIEYVSVDLSRAPIALTKEDCTALAEEFAEAHGVKALTLTFDELDLQGYLTDCSPAGTDAQIRQWDNGVLFTITTRDWETNERPCDGKAIKFDAGKWRSPLGAYYLSDCEAVCGINEPWGEYKVGAEMIS